MHRNQAASTTIKALRAAALCAAFAFAPRAVAAQEAPPAPETHASGSWVIHCFHVAGGSCDMSQSTVFRGRMKIASIVIAYLPKNSAFVGQFVVPLGVSFDEGLGLEIGTFRATHLRYRRCERDGCYVEGTLPQALIDAMSAPGADKGAMDVQLADGHKFQIPIDLNGFAGGIDMLKKLTPVRQEPAKPAPQH